jgi:FAD/FMN-containing dehydrogenase
VEAILRLGRRFAAGFHPPPQVRAAPARRFWDPSLYAAFAPDRVIVDDRPGAPAENIFWAGNLNEAGAVWYAYQSAWLPASLLEANQREILVDALFAAAKHLGTALHCNKGLAGAPAEAIVAAKDTAMNPAVTDAFALAITGAFAQPAYPGVPGHEPDEAAARTQSEAVGKSMDEIRKLLPRIGSYVWETDFFQANWQDAFWGDNYARLRAVKDKYDPGGLFFLHHGVGSEDWSEDGFTRRS